MKKQASTRPASAVAAAPDPVTAGSLVALTILGALSAIWGVVLWRQLALTRAGGQPFCPLGEAADCARAWDSAFATGVHNASGLPVAAWGVVWGLAAFVLPLIAWRRGTEGADRPALLSAIRITAAAGVLAVCVTAGVSASERAFCGGCFIWYLLVAAYAGTALIPWRRMGLPDVAGGLAWSAGATLLAFAALLYPGAKTPRSAAEADRAALAAVPVPSPRGSGAEADGKPAETPGPPGAVANEQLAAYIASLNPEQKQSLSDALNVYKSGPAQALPAPRTLLGSPRAPVRITEFTDILCNHCATLHDTFTTLRATLPPGSFTVEPRHFPLDGECNPAVQARRSDPVRCLAAKARICVEGKPGADEFAAALFASQPSLTPEKVYGFAAPVLARPALEACIASPETAARLRDDVELATRYHADGTPLVLVNGRRGTSLGAFLYAMVISEGSADDPAFASLPPPNPSAHVH